MPSRKWLAATITEAAGWATAFITAGGWSPELKILLVTILSARAVAYLLPNKDDAAS